MFCTALLLPTCNQYIFGDHCKYSTFRRWSLQQKLVLFFPPTSVTESQQLCEEEEEEGDNAPCSVWCHKKINHENLLVLSSSIVLPACLDNLACQWMLQMPYKKKGFSFPNWTRVFCFGLTCITKHSISFKSFPNRYLLKCNFNKVHIFPWTLYTAAT